METFEAAAGVVDYLDPLGISARLCIGAQEGRAAVASRLPETRDERLKLFATMTMLRCRKDERALLEDGDYQALDPRGAGGEHLCAFARTPGDRRVVIAVPRLGGRRPVVGSDLPVGAHQ